MIGPTGHGHILPTITYLISALSFYFVAYSLPLLSDGRVLR